MNPQIRLAALLVWLLVMSAVSGCGSAKKVKITGKLMKDGQPLVVERDTYVSLLFVLDADPSNKQKPNAKINRATGAYNIEVLAGKYKVNYMIMEKDKPAWQVPDEQKAKLYDLTKDQELDIVIK